MSAARFGILMAGAGLAMTLASAHAATPPKTVRAYSDCVLESFRAPGEEKGATYDEALELAQSQCGNLRPAAISDIRKTFGAKLAAGGDDPEVAAQAYLDILVGEPAAAIWAERHPEDAPHAR